MWETPKNAIVLLLCSFLSPHTQSESSRNHAYVTDGKVYSTHEVRGTGVSSRLLGYAAPTHFEGKAKADVSSDS